MELYEYTTASFNEFVDQVFAKGESEKGMLKNLLKMALDLEESEKFIHFYLDDYSRIKAQELDPIKHTAVLYRDALYQIVEDKLKDEGFLEFVKKEDKAEENSEQNHTREESGKSDLEEHDEDEKEKVLEKSSEDDKEAQIAVNQLGEDSIKAENEKVLHDSGDDVEKSDVKEGNSKIDEEMTKTEVEQKNEPENKAQQEVDLKQEQLDKTPGEPDVSENRRADETAQEEEEKSEEKYNSNAQVVQEKVVEKGIKEKISNEKLSEDEKEIKNQEFNFEVDVAQGDESLPTTVKKTNTDSVKGNETKPNTPKLENIIVKKDSIEKPKKTEKEKIFRGKEVEGLDLDQDFYEPEIEAFQSERVSTKSKKKGSYESNRETPKVLKPISKDFNNQELQKAIKIEARKGQEDEALDLDQDFVEVDNVPEEGEGEQAVLLVDVKTGEVQVDKEVEQENVEINEPVVEEDENQDLKNIEDDEVMKSRDEEEEEIPFEAEKAEGEAAEQKANVDAEAEYKIVKVTHHELRSITEEDSKDLETYKSITKSEAERNNLSIDKALLSPENQSAERKLLIVQSSKNVSRKQSAEADQQNKVDAGSVEEKEKVSSDQQTDGGSVEEKEKEKVPSKTSIQGDNTQSKPSLLTPSPVETKAQVSNVSTRPISKGKEEAEMNKKQSEKQIDHYSEVSFRASSSREYQFEDADLTEKKEDVVLNQEENVSKSASQKSLPKAQNTIEQGSEKKQETGDDISRQLSQESETQRVTSKSSGKVEKKDTEKNTPKSVEIVKTERDEKQEVAVEKKVETPTHSDKSSAKRIESEKEQIASKDETDRSAPKTMNVVKTESDMKQQESGVIEKKVTSPSNSDNSKTQQKEQALVKNETERSLPKSIDAVKTEGDAKSEAAAEKKVPTSSRSNKAIPKQKETEKDKPLVKKESDKNTRKIVSGIKIEREENLENAIVDKKVAKPTEPDYLVVKNETERSVPKSTDLIKTETDLKYGNFTSERNTTPPSARKINIKQKETELSQIHTETERLNIVRHTNSTERGNKVHDEEIVTFSNEDGESSRQVPSSVRREEAREKETHVSEHVVADDEPRVAQRIDTNSVTTEQPSKTKSTVEDKPRIVVQDETPKQKQKDIKKDDAGEKKASLDKSFEPKPYHRRLESMIDKKSPQQDKKNTPRPEANEKKVQEPEKRPSISRVRINVAPERSQTSSPEIKASPVLPSKHFGYGPVQLSVPLQRKNSTGAGAAKEVAKLNPVARPTLSTENNQSGRSNTAIRKGGRADTSHETPKLMDTSGLGEAEQKTIKTHIINNKKFLVDHEILANKSASQRDKEDTRHNKRDMTPMKPRGEKVTSLEPIRRNNLSQDLSATMGQQHLYVRTRNPQETSTLHRIRDKNIGEADHLNMTQGHSSQYSHNRQASISYAKKPDLEELLEPLGTGGKKQLSGAIPEDISMKIRKAIGKQKQSNKKNELYAPYDIEWTKKVLKNHFDVELEAVEDRNHGIKKWKIRKARHDGRNHSPINFGNITQDYYMDSPFRKQEEQDKYVNKNRLLKQRHSQPDQKDLGLEAILHSKDKINVNNYINKPLNPSRESSPTLEQAKEGNEYMYLINSSRPQTMHDARTGGVSRRNNLINKASELRNREIEIRTDATFGEISEVR